ncbi:PRC-barrel domain-containing protein [Vulcanococcus limneticus]|uniref:PRC-barrel domain-containing protein n=1 Tax=Vulcanococcus limneticus TaxID=2170428 RepID=UPI001E3ED726|nr:PRC-barrel domain-containing protein [Vulcanococcus limneticus]
MTTTPGSDPTATPAATPSDRLWLRSELMGTQVITRDTGRRLGVVGEVVVDIDRREVVALGLRDNPLTRFLPGLPRWMPLESIRQVGDVILVDSADSLAEGFNPERYSKVINCQVITEAGEQLGKVLGFSFDIETGELTTLVLGALGIPLLGEGVLSTWELAVEEIVSSGPDRIIVYEGAEEKLKQLGTGLLEKLGIGGPSWEQEERERYRLNMVPVENQLAAGQPAAEPQQQRRIQPATSRRVEFEPDYDYVEVEERRQREPLRQRRYLDEEEERGSDRLRDEVPSYGRDPERNDRPEAYGREPAYLEAEPREPAYREPQRREPQRRDPDDRSTDYRDDGSRQPEPLGREPAYREPAYRDPTPAYRQQEPAPRAADEPRTPLRRSLRDEGPLDVEPVDLNVPPSPERRDLGDPW